MRIVAAGNTVVPAYLALLEKGYQVSCSPAGERKELWRAWNSDDEFIAEDPLTLLGLITLHEIRGANWQAPDREIDAYFERFYPSNGASGEQTGDAT